MRVLSALLGILALLALFCGASVADQTPAYRVIVHPKNPSTSVDRKFVEDAFLKKVGAWPSGELIKPADLAPESAARRAFTTEILKRSVDEVRRYWQQRIFSGRDVPPPEFSKDDEVVKYVLGHEGSIGYVSGSTNVGEVKTLVVRVE